MRLKRLLAAALAAATLAGTAGAASLSSFPDLTDPAQAEAAEFLRLLGVVNGVPGGGFAPEGTLTRAEFCKMTVEVMGNSDLVPAQMTRTIFKDVPSTHWARGYINVAATVPAREGESTGIIRGNAYGNFEPNRAVTSAEAVTILCRVLGYSSDDVSVGHTWYDGFLAAGASAGLTDGLSLSGEEAITRGDAAILFYNLYFSQPKGLDVTYLTTVGGSELDGGVVLDTDATADDGTEGAFRTTEGIYKTDRAFSSQLEGLEGDLLLDEDGKLLAFRVKEGASSQRGNILTAEAAYLTLADGTRMELEPDTVVYDKGQATTWEKVYLDLSPAAPVTFHYAASGELTHLFFPAASANDEVMVARTVPGGSNPFASMANGSYTMFKNGLPATASQLRQYDVAVWDEATRVIRVSDEKLTGIYENAAPSLTSPLTITLMGHTFEVLPAARNDLAAFDIGDRITLLLTVDHRVAGVVDAKTVSGSAVGVANISGTSATVELLSNGLTLSGEVTESMANRCHGELVTVTSYAVGDLSLSKLSGSAAEDDLDVSARKLGSAPVAENVTVYDRVKGGAPLVVPYSALTMATIDKEDIAFVSYDHAGRVSLIMLDDVTGDCYEYGFFAARTDEGTNLRYISLKNGSESPFPEVQTIAVLRNNIPGGLALSTDGKLAANVTLSKMENISRSAFDMGDMTVTIGGEAYPISETVQCYNETTKTWYTPGEEGLASARAYSDTLTLYYDRTPAQGGKIRLVTVK